MTKNKFGLPRNIPLSVQREVRQRDGFGCVVCGNAYYQYDHIGTEFKDAKNHSADEIILLCGGCHDQKTRHALSTATILRHAAAPFCKQQEFSWGPMDLGLAVPEIILGDLSVRNTRSLLAIDGEDVFSISPPLIPNGPFSVNASLFDTDGNQTLKIVNNCFLVGTENWDAEVVGNSITIRSAPRKFALILRVYPPNKIVVERLDMSYKKYEITCREGQPTTFKSDKVTLAISNLNLLNCDIAISMRRDRIAIGESRLKALGVKHRPKGIGQPALQGTLFRDPKKQGRNEICRCGSGKKYKHCHGAI